MLQDCTNTGGDLSLTSLLIYSFAFSRSGLYESAVYTSFLTITSIFAVMDLKELANQTGEVQPNGLTPDYSFAKHENHVRFSKICFSFLFFVEWETLKFLKS